MGLLVCKWSWLWLARSRWRSPRHTHRSSGLPEQSALWTFERLASFSECDGDDDDDEEEEDEDEEEEDN